MPHDRIVTGLKPSSVRLPWRTHLIHPDTSGRRTLCGIYRPAFSSRAVHAIWPWGSGIADCQRCLRSAHPLVRATMAARGLHVRFGKRWRLTGAHAVRLAEAHHGRPPRAGFEHEF